MVKFVRVKVDIDNVLNNLCRQMIDIYNEENNGNLVYENITDYGFNCIEDRNIVDSLYEMFLQERVLDSLTPPPLAQQGLMQLCNRYDVWLTTASNHNVFAQKVNWCKKFFPWIEEDRVICIKDKYLVSTDYSIDDWQGNLFHDNAHRILIDAPWNRGLRDDIWGFHRVSNMMEAYKKIEEIQASIENELY